MVGYLVLRVELFLELMNLAFLCGGEVFGIVTTHGGWLGGWCLSEGSSTTGDDRSGKQIWLWRAHHPSPSLARSFLSSPPLLLLLLLLPLRLRVCIACQRGPVRSFVRSKQSNRASRKTTTCHTHITTTGPGKKFGPICDNW